MGLASNEDTTNCYTCSDLDSGHLMQNGKLCILQISCVSFWGTESPRSLYLTLPILKPCMCNYIVRANITTNKYDKHIVPHCEK